MSDQSEMEEVIVEFLVESKEGLDRVDDDLLTLEKDPTNRQPLASIFRAVHTIKGTAGFLAYERLQAVAHAGESLLSLLRDGERVFDPDVASALFATVDALREMLQQIENTRTDGKKDHAALIANLERLLHVDGATGDAETEDDAVTAAPAPVSTPTPTVVHAPAPTVVAKAPAVVPTPAAPQAARPAAPATPVAETASDDERAHDAAPARGPGATATTPAAASASAAETSVRVDVALLDKLMNLVGELVLGRNQILQFAGLRDDPAFQNTSQRLNLITTELQENVMKTRMQPIGNALHKFPRLVRDLALLCKKLVRVEIEGENTELDRTLLDAIRDPLTHAVRNSIDHGIELPDVRMSRGKSAEGLLQIRALHQGGQVTIEIIDDGAGINAERVRDKALSRGLITPEQAERMDERDLVNLIFLPGFSTAEQVSNISGRGVGMDVVRTNVERVGGTVDVTSVAGKGATIRIRLPLTLAIIPALLVSEGSEHYAIPQINLVELVRLEGDLARRGIERVHDAAVYRLRGNLLPLIFLDQLLTGSGGRSGEALNREVVNIVVLNAEDRQFGLVVDKIADTAEIVVKPLSKLLKNTAVFAGATIMGDGSVALILDTGGVATSMSLSSTSSKRQARPGAQAGGGADNRAGTTTGLLLCDLAPNRTIAIPLHTVIRLEEVARDALERLGDATVLQYRGDILQVLDLGGLLSDVGGGGTNPYQLVACRAKGGQQFGLLVDQIRDVVENAAITPLAVSRPGLLGSVTVDGRLVEVMDVARIASDTIAFSESTEVAA
jgi:two-component system chemotaxis sensor kinase CheA